MIRFIYVCMAVVLFSGFYMASQSLTNGINDAYDDVVARNTVTTVEPAAAPTDDGISFEEIYANAKTPEQTGEAFHSPEELNSIDTAAGGDDFPRAFSGKAPKALAEPTAPAVPAEQSATE